MKKARLLNMSLKKMKIKEAEEVSQSSKEDGGRDAEFDAWHAESSAATS